LFAAEWAEVPVRPLECELAVDVLPEELPFVELLRLVPPFGESLRQSSRSRDLSGDSVVVSSTGELLLELGVDLDQRNNYSKLYILDIGVPLNSS